jgi:hypothetical protein
VIAKCTAVEPGDVSIPNGLSGAFGDVSSQELRQLELILKKIGKRAEGLAEKKRSL